MRYSGRTGQFFFLERITTDSLQTPDRALRIATDLANTYRRGEETLHTPADLRRFLLDHAEPEPVTVTAQDLAEVRAIRRRLREVYESADQDDAAAILTQLLAEHATRPYLSAHDGSPWHLHVTTMDASWAQGLAAMSATALATVAAGYGFEALRSCAASDCDTVFVSTRQTRRFCSANCATRTRVSAHRARHRST